MRKGFLRNPTTKLIASCLMVGITAEGIAASNQSLESTDNQTQSVQSVVHAKEVPRKQIKKSKFIKAQDAYEYALKNQATRSGEPKFDYFFAMAAINVNQYQQAIFPLERLIIAYPQNHRIRLELARSYFVIGNLDEAKKHFERVKGHKPPPNVIKNIDIFLRAIQIKQVEAMKTTFKPYAGLKVGYDTNINSGTMSEVIQTPLFSITLDRNARKRMDGFSELDAGVNINKPFDKRQSFFFSGSIKDRFHHNYKDMDQATLALGAGFQLREGKNTLRIPIQMQHVFLDRNSFMRRIGMNIELAHKVDAQNNLGLIVQAGRNTYPKTPVQDTMTFLGGAVHTYTFKQNPWMLNTALFLADDTARRVLGAHNGKQALIGSLGWNWFFAKTLFLTVDVTAQHTKYKARHPVFAAIRRDDMFGGGLNWIWFPHNKLSFNAGISYNRNKSNIAIYDYNKTALELGVKYYGG